MRRTSDRLIRIAARSALSGCSCLPCPKHAGILTPRLGLCARNNGWSFSMPAQQDGSSNFVLRTHILPSGFSSWLHHFCACECINRHSYPELHTSLVARSLRVASMLMPAVARHAPWLSLASNCLFNPSFSRISISKLHSWH